MKLLKVVIAFLLLVSIQIAAAQWLHVPPPAEARGLMMGWGGVPVVVGGAGGWTYVASATVDSASASGATADATASLNIAAGDIIVALVRYETASTSVAVAATSGEANALTGSAFANEDTQVWAGYKINAAANSTATFRCTLGADRTYRRMAILQFRPTTPAGVSLDISAAAATGTGTALASGAASTSGTDNLVIGFAGTYDGGLDNITFQIGGNAATGYAIAGTTLNGIWYRVGTISSGTATVTLGASNAWVCGIMGFK